MFALIVSLDQIGVLPHVRVLHDVVLFESAGLFGNHEGAVGMGQDARVANLLEGVVVHQVIEGGLWSFVDGSLGVLLAHIEGRLDLLLVEVLQKCKKGRLSNLRVGRDWMECCQKE